MSSVRIWYDINHIVIFGKHIAGLLDDSKEQLEVFKRAEENPHSLDDDLVERSTKLFTERNDHIKLFDEQIEKWKEVSNKSEFDKEELERLSNMIIELYKINDEITTILRKVSDFTIDKIMKMDPIELATKLLASRLPQLKSRKR